MSTKRQTKRRRSRTRAGDLEALRREMWHAVRRVSDLLDDPDTEPSETIRAANALAALGNSYRAVTETSALEQRMTELQEEINELKQASIRGASGTDRATAPPVN